MAKIIKTNGEIVNVKPTNGTDFKWNELHDIVNGYIEIVYLQNNSIMVVNEEGKIHGLPFNKKATEILWANGGYGDVIVGDVLVCDQEQVK